MNGTGYGHADKVVFQIPVSNTHEGQHGKGHGKGLLHGAESKNIECHAVPQQITHPGGRGVAVNHQRQNSMDHDRHNEQNGLVISAREKMDQLHVQKKSEILSAIPDSFAEPILTGKILKGCMVFHQVTGEKLVPETADENVDRSHKENVVFSPGASLGHEKTKNQGSRHNCHIDGSHSGPPLLLIFADYLMESSARRNCSVAFTVAALEKSLPRRAAASA